MHRAGACVRDIAALFRTSGQNGIPNADSGVPVNAVSPDFEAGAAELPSPAAVPDHRDVIEGQGPLFHPAYTRGAAGGCCMAASRMCSSFATSRHAPT